MLVRGIRGQTDAAYETKLANINKELAPEIITIFIPADPDFSQLSSSRLKQLAENGQDITIYCSKIVEAKLTEKIKGNKKLIVNRF